MPDPFAQTDSLSQPYLGGMPAPSQGPAQTTSRSVVGSMLAPRPLTPQPSIPQPAAPQPAPAAPSALRERGTVEDFMARVRAHESGGNDRATSGVADGRYQFTPQTWAGVAAQHPELGLRPNDIWDGAKQDLAMRAISKDYEHTLSLNGLPATMPNMFMLHFLGTGGGPKFLKEMSVNPNANAVAAFPTEAKYNPTIFWDQSKQPRTMQQVYALMTKSFGGPEAKMAAPDTGSTDPAMQFKPPAEARPQPELTASLRENTALEMPASTLKPLPSMTPIATGLKPLPGMTPIGDGLKLDYGAKDPLKPAGGYTDEKGGYHAAELAKDDKPAPEVIGVDPTTGAPIFADEKENAAVRHGEAEVGKGFAAGAAQDITGPASLLPNFLGGGYAEKANEYLDKTGDPFARTLGQAAPMLAPVGEIAGAAKAGAKALEAGESLLPSLGKATGVGAATGALSASSDPTDKEDYGDRIKAKLPGMAESGLAGGLISGAVPGGSAAAKWLGGEAGSFGKFISDAFGKEATKAAEDLRSGVNAETGKALTAEEQKIAQAKVEEGAARANQAAADAELKKLDDAQERLRNRMQDRVKAAEKVAERAGQNAEQAKAFAEHQEKAVTKAEESAAKLAEDFAKRPTMPAEEFGRQLQETAVKDAEALKNERAQKSGFDAAVKADKGQPSIPTKQFIAAVREAEKRAVSPAAKSALASLKDDLRSTIDKTTVTGVSIQKARRIVQDLDSRSIEGMPSDEAHEITALKDKFVEHMEKVHPQLAEARKKYAELSRPLDVYRDTGALTKSVLEDPYSGRTVVDPTKVVGALLNKTEKGADALGRVLQKGELQDSARKFFNQKLVDVAGKNPTPSEAQFANFLRDNRLALDRAGLTNEFKDLATSKATQERIAAQAKAGVDTAKRAVGEADKASAAAGRDVNAAKALKDRAAGNPLKAQRAAPEEARKQSVKELADLAGKQKTATDIREHLAKLDNKLDPKVARTGQEITAEANKTADYLKDKGYIDAEAHKELLTKIRDVEQMNLDYSRAAKLVKQAMIAIAVGALGGAGVELGHYVSHRVSP